MRFMKLIAGAASISSTLFSINSAMADEVYVCKHEFGTHVITIPANNARVANEVYTLRRADGTTYISKDRLILSSGEQYVGSETTLSFPGDSVQITDSEGNPTPCYRQNVAQNHSSGAVGGNEIALGNAPGRSLGGKVRSGPGTNFAQVGSLHLGDRISIITNTGVHFDGYDWFEIHYGNRVGYQWGGIMCSNSTVVAGMYQQCEPMPEFSNNSARPTQNIAKNGGWSAFAVGYDGKIGHGAGTTLQNARQYALKFCGDTTCQIMDETQAQCHAASETPGGFWFGAANSLSQAESYALNFCRQAGAPTCSIRHSYCR